MSPNIVPASDEAVDAAVKALTAGQLVAVPTETVYGLAADATNDIAVASIFEVKKRPNFNPLIIHVANSTMAQEFVEWSPLAEKLASAFWPGPISFVLPRRHNTALAQLVSAGQPTVAVRCPEMSIARNICEELGRPFAAPSANLSGEISPTTAVHVQNALGNSISMIIDNGPCTVGVESTIIKIEADGVRLLRPGGITRLDIEAVTGRILVPEDSGRIEAPGMLASHYAPKAELMTNCPAPIGGMAWIGFGPCAIPADFSFPVRNLSAEGNVKEAAANLFKTLHELDACAEKIAVAPIPEEGLGVAINDRLRRAAAPRP